MSTKNFMSSGNAESVFASYAQAIKGKVGKSNTSGLLKNDGTVDTNNYVVNKPTLSLSNIRCDAKTNDDYYVLKPVSFGNTPSNFNGSGIWTDGENIYYSSGSSHYVYNKATRSWETKTWTGLTEIGDVDRLYTVNGDIYYSYQGTNKKLNKNDGTWENSDLSGGYSSYMSGEYVWSDGTDIYFTMSGVYYKLVNKVWTSVNPFDLPEGVSAYPNGEDIWTDGKEIYFSSGSTQLVLDVKNHKWMLKTWYGLNSFLGQSVWSDGENIYLSDYSNNAWKTYVLDKETSTWSLITWLNYQNVYGGYVWTDGERLYYSSSGDYQIFTKKPVGSDIKQRYAVSSSGWSNSTDANGYYTYTVTILGVALDTSYAPEVLIAGADDSTFYTDTEKEEFDKLEQCNLTASNTLVLYAKDKPSNTFYIWIKGLEG